ncbi:MAG TPA: hypothetical protein VGA45_19290, partial [Actinomycetota bacterium]
PSGPGSPPQVLVVGHEDRRGNLFPAKVRENKIDAAVAPMMAIGRCQAAEAEGAFDDGPSFFSQRLFA